MSLTFKYFFPDLAYIHRMGLVFLSGLACYVTALAQGYEDQLKAINLNDISFKTSKIFNLNASIVCILLILIYATFG